MVFDPTVPLGLKRVLVMAVSVLLLPEKHFGARRRRILLLVAAAAAAAAVDARGWRSVSSRTSAWAIGGEAIDGDNDGDAVDAIMALSLVFPCNPTAVGLSCLTREKERAEYRSAFGGVVMDATGTGSAYTCRLSRGRSQTP